MDCIPPGFSVHGILWARILEWVAMPFSRGSSWSRDGSWVSCIADRFFTLWAIRASGWANCKHLPQGPLSPAGSCSSTQAAIACENTCHFVASARSRATFSLLSLSLPLIAASATPGLSVSCLTSITCSPLAPPSPTALRWPTGEPVLGRRLHASLPSSSCMPACESWKSVTCHWNHWIHPVRLCLFNLCHTKVPESRSACFGNNSHLGFSFPFA